MKPANDRTSLHSHILFLKAIELSRLPIKNAPMYVTRYVIRSRRILSIGSRAPIVRPRSLSTPTFRVNRWKHRARTYEKTRPEHPVKETSKKRQNARRLASEEALRKLRYRLHAGYEDCVTVASGCHRGEWVWCIYGASAVTPVHARAPVSLARSYRDSAHIHLSSIAYNTCMGGYIENILTLAARL